MIKSGTCGRYVKSGHLVYAREGKLLAAPFDLDKLRLTGPPAVVLQGVTTTVVEKAQFGVSENGTLVYAPGSASDSGRRPVWVDRQGAVMSLMAPAREYKTPRLSPDGQQVVVNIGDDIWICVIHRGILTRLTFGAKSRSPPWRPDGKRVTFSSFNGGTCQLWSKLADGSGPEELLTQMDALSMFRPGRRIVRCWHLSRPSALTVGIFGFFVARRAQAAPVPPNPI